MKRKFWLPNKQTIRILAKRRKGIDNIQRTCGNCHWSIINGDYNIIKRLFTKGCPYPSQDIHCKSYDLIKSPCSGIIREKE